MHTSNNEEIIEEIKERLRNEHWEPVIRDALTEKDAACERRVEEALESVAMVLEKPDHRPKYRNELYQEVSDEAFDIATDLIRSKKTS